MIVFAILSIILAGLSALLGLLPVVAFSWVAQAIGPVATGIANTVAFLAGGPFTSFMQGLMVILGLVLAARLVFALLRWLHVLG